MLPKIITGWQRDLVEFSLEYHISMASILSVDGKEISVVDLREWLIFCSNLTNSDPNYVIVIQNTEMLSVESQNVLLKPLEEKRENIEMFLLASSEKQILPTIVSRCEVLQARKNKEMGKFWNEVVRLWRSGPAEIIAYCEVTSTDVVSDLLKEIVSRLKLEISKEVSFKRVKILKLFLDTLSEVSVGNVNKKMALENLLLKSWKLIKA